MLRDRPSRRKRLQTVSHTNLSNIHCRDHSIFSRLSSQFFSILSKPFRLETKAASGIPSSNPNPSNRQKTNQKVQINPSDPTATTNHHAFRPLKPRSKQWNPLRQQRPLRTLRPTNIPANARRATRTADATSATDASDAASTGTDKAQNEEKESPQGPGVVRGHMSAAYLWWLARRLFVTGSAVRCFDCGFILT